ncbi:hypothetical protein K491DRAFT_419293 [Lophiostoma macrostomum CBS 122681]|uniref:Uncharacterized protein n=1 Tax=Lophiostoma macrostomum CBS 122681 TaxID=1314788 RepID=A0A6A6TNE7_9PLEO|nr:hypothetical protein K491DRAFT_419293 [Lophiostoma macrostomum CBS 122681]
MKVTDSIATLMIVLPSSFEGGQICLSHVDESKPVNLDLLAYTDFQYLLSWGGEVRCYFEGVTSGVRLVLVYNLQCVEWRDTTVPYQGLCDFQIEPLRDALTRWQRASWGPSSPYFLVHFLDYQYSKTALKTTKLKGNDVPRTKILLSMCEELGFRLFFTLPTRVTKAVLSYRTAGVEDNKDPEDVVDVPHVYSEYLSLNCWWALDGPEHTTSLQIPVEEILQQNVLCSIPCDDSCVQLDGNVLMSDSNRAFNAALVLVPPRNALAFEIRHGMDESFDRECGKDAPEEQRSYHMKDYLCKKLHTYRCSDSKFNDHHELRQVCEVLLGLQHEFRGGWGDCEVSGAHLRAMDKIAAIGIELDMEYIFHSACQLIESYPECNKCSYGCYSEATFEALVHFACDNDPYRLRGFTCKYLNMFISQKGNLFERVFACDQFTERLPKGSTSLNIHYWRRCSTSGRHQQEMGLETFGRSCNTFHRPVSERSMLLV